MFNNKTFVWLDVNWYSINHEYEEKAFWYFWTDAIFKRRSWCFSQQITPLQVFIVFYFLCCTSLEKHIGLPVNWETILTYYWSVVALRRRIVNSSHTICHHPSYNAKREVERSGRGTSRSLMKSNDTVAVWVIETLWTDTKVPRRLSWRHHSQ